MSIDDTIAAIPCVHKPLTSADCDLRDFAYMPLDVLRLRDSTIANQATGEGFRCAVLLWCASWHQVPAASLPDCDSDLAQLAGFGRSVAEWVQHRSDALHGWVKCSDGRLYHPVVAEKAREAFKAKQRQRWASELARIKKHNQRHGTSVNVPDCDDWISQGCPRTQTPGVSGDNEDVPKDNSVKTEGTNTPSPQNVPRETASKGKGKGKGKGEENQIPGEPSFAVWFDTEFWPLYPRKIGKDAAKKSAEKATRGAPRAEIIDGLRRYRFSSDPQYQPHASTWLNEGRWKVEADTKPPVVRDGLFATQTDDWNQF